MICPHCAADQPEDNHFCGQCGVRLEPVADLHTSVVLGSETVGERGYVTVLFCDLVDSSTLMQSLHDPELYQQRVIAVYRDLSQRIITDHGGKIVEFQGDGVVARFSNREDSTESAVRAARDMILSVRQFRHRKRSDVRADPYSGSELQLRIGIASGPAVTQPMHDPDQPEPQILGTPPYLASRLQTRAQVNEVLVSDSVYQQVRKHFRFYPVDNLNLKGFPDDTRAWKLGCPNDGYARFELTDRINLTPLVGRSEVLDSLKQRWARIKQGMGQVVFVHGEPGIGKSRIVSEFQRSMTRFSEPKIILRYQCQSFAQETPLFPIVQQFSHAAGIDVGDNKDTVEQKLRDLLASWQVDIKHYMRLLLPIVLNQSNLSPDKPTTEREIEKAVRACTILPFLFTIRCPVLVIIEDMHWADSASMELLSRSMVKAKSFQMLIIVTARPEYHPPPSRYDYVTDMHIKRMNTQAARQLLNRVVLSQQISPYWVERIIDKSEGVPLYIEEMALHLSHLQATQQDDVSASSMSLPASLFDSFIERFYRMNPPQQQLTRMAAVLGPRFDLISLQLISDMSPDDIQDLLLGMCKLDICNPVGDPVEWYEFSHALLHDAIYDSMLKQQKYQLHRKMIDALHKFSPSLTAITKQQIRHHQKMVNEYAVYGDDDGDDSSDHDDQSDTANAEKSTKNDDLPLK